MGRFPMEVKFPGLGISLEVNDVFLTIGNFSIKWYAVLIMTGFGLAIWYAFRNHKRYGIAKDPLLTLILWGAALGIAGGRLGYVLFHSESVNSLWDVINIRSGGMMIYGSVITVVVGAYFLCRHYKQNYFAIMDVTVIGYFIGQSIGRWGNFANQEAFGSATGLPWRMQSLNTELVAGFGSAVHPCFLYESVWCALGFVLLHIVSKKWYKFRGQLLLIYAVWYGSGRAVIEGLRTDSLWLVQDVIRISQLLGIVTSIAGAALLVLGLKGIVKFPPIEDYVEPEAVPKKTFKEEIKGDWEKIKGLFNKEKNK